MWLPTAPICALYFCAPPAPWPFPGYFEISSIPWKHLLSSWWITMLESSDDCSGYSGCDVMYLVITSFQTQVTALSSTEWSLVCVWSCQCHRSVTHGVTRSLITFWLWQYSCSKIKWTVNYLLRPEFSIKHAKVLMSEYNRNLFVEFDLLTHIKLSLIVLLNRV